VVVDVKQDGLERPLAALLDRMDAWGRVIIGSFSDRRLVTMIRESSGKAQVSAGPRAARKWWLASRVGRPGPAGYVALQVPPSMYGLGVIDRRFVRTAERAGLQVHVWTVNQPADVARLWELGVHGIITDRPDHIAARL
jgi:glycerophosphoryl diester phosphodiesterase